jgi:glycogen debranching enzyme
LGDELTDRAARLKKQFNEQFWIPERGYYAIALDGKKRQVDACASNMGHCLLQGLIDQDKAPMVAEHLMSPEMFSGWGVRTLASDMGAYNPASYHNGSVWPHDNAIVAAGLLRYGFVEEAQRIATGMIDAAEYSEGRLPELFCGFSREQPAIPVPYPTACSPVVSAGGGWMDPVLPESFGDLHISNAPLGGGRITIDIANSVPSVLGLPEGMTFHQGHRPWMSELVHQADHRRRQRLENWGR